MDGFKSRFFMNRSSFLTNCSPDKINLCLMLQKKLLFAGFLRILESG